LTHAQVLDLDAHGHVVGVDHACRVLCDQGVRRAALSKKDRSEPFEQSRNSYQPGVFVTWLASERGCGDSESRRETTKRPDLAGLLDSVRVDSRSYFLIMIRWLASARPLPNGFELSTAAKP
jgi:hypothetical protein